MRTAEYKFVSYPTNLAPVVEMSTDGRSVQHVSTALCTCAPQPRSGRTIKQPSDSSDTVFPDGCAAQPDPGGQGGGERAHRVGLELGDELRLGRNVVVQRNVGLLHPHPAALSRHRNACAKQQRKADARKECG